VALVVDASALVEVVLSPRHADLRDRLASELVHAPHLADVETGDVLRQLVLRKKLTAAGALDFFAVARSLIDVRHELTNDLAALAWSLRANLTFYDASYVSLASALDLPVLTADRKLAHAPGLPCEVELV